MIEKGKVKLSSNNPAILDDPEFVIRNLSTFGLEYGVKYEVFMDNCPREFEYWAEKVSPNPEIQYIHSSL